MHEYRWVDFLCAYKRENESPKVSSDKFSQRSVTVREGERNGAAEEEEETTDQQPQRNYSLPLVNNNPASISVTIVVKQTLATIGNVDQVFRFWALQEGRALPPDHGLPPAILPPIQPWSIDSRWGYDLWTLVVMVLNEYLAQPRPIAELAFLETIRHCYVASTPNHWIVDLTVHVATVVRLSPWAWGTIFRQWRRVKQDENTIYRGNKQVNWKIT